MKWLLVLLCLASPGLAQTVAVASGEHDTYSRLVLPLPEGTDWQMGRTAAGYELAMSGSDLRFDLSAVFDLIPKTRLTGIFAEPATGRLQLALKCVCHAMPFQLDARTLVIDLRDGAAPPGSSFELALDGSSLPPLLQARQPRPRARPDTAMAAPGAAVAMPSGAEYDWIVARTPGSAQAANPKPIAGPLRPTSTDLRPLRETLIRQLSRGAADGVIDLALPEGDVEPAGIPENPQLRVTDAPGMSVQTRRAAPDVLQPDGVACLPDVTLDLAAWGQEGDTPAQIAAARAALVGEFDKPDQAAVAQSVRHHLYLGFGAEAEMTIASFDATDADVPVWIALARIMDGRDQTENVFAAMAGCDTAAALWSVLAAAPTDPLDGVNIPAVRRAFSALPAHLRLHLAAQLAERATAMGEDALARAVTVATNRATTMPAGTQAILQAQTDLADGRLAEVVIAMEAVLAEGGPTVADAVILLVEAKLALSEPVSADIPGVAAALLPEYEGTDTAPALVRAWQVSMAAAGDFDGAFAAQPDAATMPDIWQLLARLGTDEAVLVHGIVPPGAAAVADRAVAMRLAERLLDLGFADAAAHWASPVGPQMTEAEQTLTARIALAQGNGRAVLTTLAGQTAPEALILKAQAEQALGQPALARLTWAAAGDAVASARAAGWAQSWADVAQGEEGPWRAAAAGVVMTPQSSEGPLANAQALVDDSAAMRAILTALLASVPQP